MLTLLDCTSSERACSAPLSSFDFCFLDLADFRHEPPMVIVPMWRSADFTVKPCPEVLGRLPSNCHLLFLLISAVSLMLTFWCPLVGSPCRHFSASVIWTCNCASSLLRVYWCSYHFISTVSTTFLHCRHDLGISSGGSHVELSLILYSDFSSLFSQCTLV